jgi:hypothetical protein
MLKKMWWIFEIDLWTCSIVLRGTNLMNWSKSFINSSNANRLSLPSADWFGGLFAVKD